MKDKRRLVRIVGNITFGLAIVFTIYLLINFFVVRKDLLPGVCPVGNNRVLMYWTIGLAIISFILSIIESRLNKD
ncbi:MAG TPA: hypothetical protein VFD57_00575 [Clostridia bacterium]|nr:hypothetical protein [Clostridia bacterium]